VIYKNRIRGEVREKLIEEIRSRLQLPQTEDEQVVLDYLVAFANAHPEYAQRAISDAAGIRDCVLYYERNGCKHGQTIYLAHRKEVVKAIRDLFPDVSISVGLCDALKSIHARGLVCSRYLLRDLLVENGYTYHVRPKKRGSIYRSFTHRPTTPDRRVHESERS